MTLLFGTAAAFLICTVLAILFQIDFGSLGPLRFLACVMVTFILLMIWLVRVIATELLIEAEAALGPTPGQPPFRGSPGQSDKSAGARCEIGPPALR